jgi:hypothetical protein
MIAMFAEHLRGYRRESIFGRAGSLRLNPGHLTNYPAASWVAIEFSVISSVE